MEKWFRLFGFMITGKYEISNKGNVRRIEDGKLIDQKVNKKGESYVMLEDKNGVMKPRLIWKLVKKYTDMEEIK